MDKMFDLDVQVQSSAPASASPRDAEVWTGSCFCSIGTDATCWLNPM